MSRLLVMQQGAESAPAKSGDFTHECAVGETIEMLHQKAVDATGHLRQWYQTKR